MSTRTSKRVPLLPSHFPPRWQLKVVYKYTWEVRISGPDAISGPEVQIGRSDLDLSIRTSGPESCPDRISDLWSQNRDSGAKVPKSRNPAEIPKSCRIQKIQDFAEISTFREKSRFLRNPGFQDPTGFWRFRRSGVHMDPDFESMCTLMSETASDLMCTARPNVHPHIDTTYIVSECILVHGINLVLFVANRSFVRFENNFWNK